MKLSYNCCSDIISIITQGEYHAPKSNCNCRDSGSFLLDQRCMIKYVIYEAEATATLDDKTTDKKTCTGLCEREFKNGYANH